MNVALWIVQALLAFAFAVSGTMKLTRSKEQARERMPYVEDFSAGTLKLIGAAELIGAVGLIVPWLTGIATVLTPLAACGLVVIMLGAAATHLRRKEYSSTPINLVLGGLALFVALGRF